MNRKRVLSSTAAVVALGLGLASGLAKASSVASVANVAMDGSVVGPPLGADTTSTTESVAPSPEVTVPTITAPTITAPTTTTTTTTTTTQPQAPLRVTMQLVDERVVIAWSDLAPGTDGVRIYRDRVLVAERSTDPGEFSETIEADGVTRHYDFATFAGSTESKSEHHLSVTVGGDPAENVAPIPATPATSTTAKAKPSGGSVSQTNTVTVHDQRVKVVQTDQVNKSDGNNVSNSNSVVVGR